jgi:hypothetical protein
MEGMPVGGVLGGDRRGTASSCDWLRPLFPEVPPGRRGRKIPDDGRSSASEAVAPWQRGCPLGFRHGLIASSCGDPLRNVKPEKPLLTVSPFLLPCQDRDLRLAGKAQSTPFAEFSARPSARQANAHDPASLSSTATCSLRSSGPEVLRRPARRHEWWTMQDRGCEVLRTYLLGRWVNNPYARRHPMTSGVPLTSKPILGGSTSVTPPRCSTRSCRSS